MNKKDPAERFLASVDEMILADCVTCRHFRRHNNTCPAYPAGVPTDILEVDARHREVRPDQVGEYVYTPEAE